MRNSADQKTPSSRPNPPQFNKTQQTQQKKARGQQLTWVGGLMVLSGRWEVMFDGFCLELYLLGQAG